MRTMKKKRFPVIAIAAALAVLAAGMKLPAIYAAEAVDVSKPCSLTLSVPDTGLYAEDLAGTELDVELYRVASLASSGAYTSTEAFASLKIEDISAGAEEWENTARAAAKLVQDKVDEGKALVPDAEFSIMNGKGSAEGLETGMYLVMVKDAVTEKHEYSFNPYIIALPDNLYYQSGDVADDIWLYDAEGGLKPEQKPRYGSLKIRKTLSEFNETLRDTTFVFQVEGVDENGKTVYSNVVSTTHNAAGTREAVIDKIPAGTTVTVTEVYSGASYKPESPTEATVTIVADQVMQADFTNTYSGKLIPGYGVTNRFDHNEDGSWKWTQLEDSSAAGE